MRRRKKRRRKTRRRQMKRGTNMRIKLGGGGGLRCDGEYSIGGGANETEEQEEEEKMKKIKGFLHTRHYYRNEDEPLPFNDLDRHLIVRKSLDSSLNVLPAFRSRREVQTHIHCAWRQCDV
jgi:hypothetical protein